MVTKDDIEQFLNRLNADGASFKEVQNGLWVVKPGGSLDFDLVVHYSPPVVVLRVKVMELPDEADALAQLSRRLLEMNASEMLHGSYGVEENAVVITEALELSHLDFEEFLAVYESISIALASHLREIGELGTTGAHRVPAALREPASRRGRGAGGAKGGGNRGRNGGRSGGKGAGKGGQRARTNAAKGKRGAAGTGRGSRGRR